MTDATGRGDQPKPPEKPDKKQIDSRDGDRPKPPDKAGARTDDAPVKGERRSSSDSAEAAKARDGDRPKPPDKPGARTDDAPVKGERRSSSDSAKAAKPRDGDRPKPPDKPGIHRDAPEAKEGGEARHTVEASKEASSEAKERQKVVIPEQGMGFRHGSADPGDQFTRWLARQSPQMIEAMRRPDTLVVISASASRSGSEKSNQRLSEGRANAVKERLKQEVPNFQAQVVVAAWGEQPAKAMGKPDGKDSAPDRVALVEIVPRTPERIPQEGNIEQGLKSFLQSKDFALPESTKHGEQVLGIIWGGVKEGLKAFGKAAVTGQVGIAPEKGAAAFGKHVAKKGAEFVLVNLVADFRDKPILANITSNVASGFQNRLEVQTGVERKTEFQNPLVNSKSPYFSAGAEIFSIVWNGLSQAEKNNITVIMHSHQRTMFTHQLVESALDRWVTRGAVQSPRDLR